MRRVVSCLVGRVWMAGAPTGALPAALSTDQQRTLRATTDKASGSARFPRIPLQGRHRLCDAGGAAGDGAQVLKRKIAARILTRSGLGRLISAVAPPSGILILNYDRIGDGSTSPYDRGLWSADAEAFDAQVARLARDCDVISPADIESVAGRRGRHVLITFDDGY